MRFVAKKAADNGYLTIDKPKNGFQMTLTDLGREVIKKRLEAEDKAADEILAGLSDEEKAQLTSLCEKICQTAEDMGVDYSTIQKKRGKKLCKRHHGKGQGCGRHHGHGHGCHHGSPQYVFVFEGRWGMQSYAWPQAPWPQASARPLSSGQVAPRSSVRDMAGREPLEASGPPFVWVRLGFLLGRQGPRAVSPLFVAVPFYTACMQYHDFGKGAIHGRGLRVSEGDGAHVLPGYGRGRQSSVRPFGTIDLYEGRLYIQTGKNKKVLSADPRSSRGRALRMRRPQVVARDRGARAR